MSAALGASRSGRYLSGQLPVVHGFTTRAGGVSEGAFGALNLGLSSGDKGTHVEENRDALLSELGFARTAVCAFHQVHAELHGTPVLLTEHGMNASTFVARATTSTGAGATASGSRCGTSVD